MPARISDAQLEVWARRIGELVKVEGYAPPGKRVADGEINATSAMADELGLKRKTFQPTVRKMVEKGFDRHWLTEPRRLPLKPAEASPVRSSGRVYLLTAAQDDTSIHEAFWANLKAYAKHRDGEILCGGFTYQKGLFTDHSVEAGVFHHELAPHLSPSEINLAPGLVWNGRANIMPTAVNPVSGWDTQSGRSWMTLPHAKIVLKTIPVMPGQWPKQVMTTGVVTLPNYVERNQGQKAEFHHTIGALVVEVAADGNFWCRHIHADADGSFQDLDTIVHNERISAGHSIEGLVPGDLHADDQDEICARHCLGLALHDREPLPGSMIEVLRPSVWFAHDSFSFAPRSHHTIKDPHERARLFHGGNDNVQAEIRLVSQYLARLRNQGPEIVHVASNHNMHLDKWLKEGSAHIDAPNARYWHELNMKWHRAIEHGANHRWLIHEEAMRAESQDRLEGVRFLAEGESYEICQGVNPIECGLHSHVGPRGARGSVNNLSNVPVRMIIGHGHSPAIKEGVRRSGTLGNRQPSYAAKGPGDWMPAHVIATPNGKTQTITQTEDGRWRLG